MNKNLRCTAPLAALALGIATFLTSCKEKATINMGTNIATDTTYMAAVETAQPRNVLMEEFTGVSCPPCPNGHKALAALTTMYGDRLPVIGIQVYNFIQALPVIENGDTITKHDNRTQAGTDLSNDIYGKLGQTPVAGIDRVIKDPTSSTLYVDRTVWGTSVANRMNVPTKANVFIISSFDAGTKIAIIKVHVAYTAALSHKQKLTVALIEDKVEDAQEDGLTVIEDYEHEHVLRDVLTFASGSAIMNDVTAIEPGRVYERTFIYDMSKNPLWAPDNCKIIAFVSNADAGDKEIQQAATVKLK